MRIKLMVRGLARHKKRGKRLFVLLSLCSAVLVFLMTFGAEFGRQYRDLFIGIQTGHLQVLPPDSPVFDVNPWGGARKQDVPMITVTPEFDAWVRRLPEVEEAAPEINRWGNAFNLDSEYESWVSLVAVPADRLAKLFPLAKVLSGPGGLDWTPGMKEVPVYHARLETEFGQKNPDPDHFSITEFLAKPERLDPFKAKLRADFPRLFGTENLSGRDRNQRFLELLNQALVDRHLGESIPHSRLVPYDWRIDDAVAAVRENTDPARTPFLNKRVFQALYPKDIAEIREPILPGKSVTLEVPALKSTGALDQPMILPGRYTGMVDTMPLYTPNSFIDLGAFRHYMKVPDDQAAAYVIRLKSDEDTPVVKARVEAWLRARGSTAKVTDYQFLGKIYLATASAFDAINFILVGIFVLILAIFIVNLVLMSMIQRRQEIGTGLALGLSNSDTILILLGEVGAIVMVSWAAGSVLGALLVGAASLWGVPGMIFFPGQKLFLAFHPEAFVQTLALLLFASLLAALVPLLGLRTLLPVDLFKEVR